MKANELKIGNLLYNDGVIVTIDARSIFDIWDDKGLKKYEAIILTHDWLLKFGFEIVHVKNKHYIINDPNGYKDSHKISILQTLNNQWYIAFSDNLGGYKDYIPTTKIKYVHQLQNLYFALTNEELTIKN